MKQVYEGFEHGDALSTEEVLYHFGKQHSMFKDRSWCKGSLPYVRWHRCSNNNLNGPKTEEKSPLCWAAERKRYKHS